MSKGRKRGKLLAYDVVVISALGIGGERTRIQGGERDG